MLSELDVRCLWAIADDYEEVPHIRVQLKQEFKSEIPSKEISLSLFKLVGLQMATAHRFDEHHQIHGVDYTFERAQEPHSEIDWQPGEPCSGKLYFLITPRGLDHLKTQLWIFPQA